MSTSTAVRLHNFKWSDLDDFQKLLNTIGSHGHRDWAVEVEDLRSELQFPRVRPEQNIALATRNDETVGYAIVEPEINIGRSVIGIGTKLGGMAIRKQLMDWASAHAKNYAPIAHLSTRDNEIELEKLIDQLEWKKVRQYLKLATSSDLSKAPARLPRGFTKRTMLGLDEVPELTYLQNESFKRHFGYSPNTEDEIKAHLLATGASVDDVVMVHDSNEQLVAYCWTESHEHEGHRVGRIGMTGVLPSTRKRGLGRAIAEAGYNHLLNAGVESMELDVDSKNAPAIRVYSSLGFKQVSAVNWWERKL